MSEMLGYEELSELTGRSIGALRVARSKGRLPDQDAPGPKWRRESLAEFLKEGAAVPAGGPPAPPAPGSGTPASPATPAPPAGVLAPPVASGPAPSTTAPPFPGEDAEDRRRRSMTIADVLACPHPVQDRKVLPYMVLCVVCGRRQEGRDRFTGGGYAAWTAGWQATCPHPEGERRHHPWGVQCGVCGSSVR